MALRRSTWTLELVADTKARIKSELDDVESRSGAAARLAHIQARIAELEDTLASRDLLERYVYLVSELVFFQRNGAMPPARAKRISSLACSILQVAGVDPERSRLSGLYADVHLLLSQIYRKAGNQWFSAWDQQLSMRYGTERDPNGGGVSVLGAAIRVMRVGDGAYAAELFSAAEALGLDRRRVEQARLGRLKALRLARRDSERHSLLRELRGERELSARGIAELDWEELCAMVQATGEVAKMLEFVRARRSEIHPTYSLEAFLWAVASPSRSAAASAPKPSRVAQRSRLNVRTHGRFHRCALVIEACLDTRIPFWRRLVDLGDELGRTHQLISVDKELLLWAAAARWLFRVDNAAPALLALNEYRALSRRLSDGAHTDVLGLLADVEAGLPFERVIDALPDVSKWA